MITNLFNFKLALHILQMPKEVNHRIFTVVLKTYSVQNKFGFPRVNHTVGTQSFGPDATHSSPYE